MIPPALDWQPFNDITLGESVNQRLLSRRGDPEALTLPPLARVLHCLKASFCVAGTTLFSLFQTMCVTVRNRYPLFIEPTVSAEQVLPGELPALVNTTHNFRGNIVKKFNKLVVAMMAMGCGGAFAQVETYNPSWYVTPSLNVIHPDSRFGVNKNGEGVGLRWGKPLSQHWDIQFGPTFARSRDSGLRYDQLTLGADWLYMFSRSNFRPFLLLGLGAERDKVEGSGADKSKTSPYINGGLGFQYSFNDKWSTQVDWRRVHGYLRDNNDFGTNGVNNNYLTVGLTYTFDSPPKQVAAAMPEPAVTPPPPPPAPVAPAPRFERYTLSSTELFAFDSAKLRQPQSKLDDIAKVLNDNPSIDNVVVTGYTDRLGSDKYNQKLSLRRANSVKDYLTGKGVNPARIAAEGKGEANPVVECKQTKRAALIDCLEPNRRVEVEQITVERRVN